MLLKEHIMFILTSQAKNVLRMCLPVSVVVILRELAHQEVDLLN